MTEPAQLWKWDDERRSVRDKNFIISSPCGKAPWRACCLTLSGLLSTLNLDLIRSTFGQMAIGLAITVFASFGKPLACIMHVLIDLLHGFLVVSVLLYLDSGKRANSIGHQCARQRQCIHVVAQFIVHRTKRGWLSVSCRLVFSINMLLTCDLLTLVQATVASKTNLARNKNIS